jgi:hypothetical protein
MSVEPDLRLVPGPGLLAALLDVAGRAGLHPRKLLVPSHGDELTIEALAVQAVGLGDAHVHLHLRHRGFGAGGERQFAGVAPVRLRWALVDGALLVSNPRVDAAGHTLLASWGFDAGTPELPGLVEALLAAAWSAPLPLAWPGSSDDGALGVVGGGRKRPAPAPPPPPGDLALAASHAGLARLAHPAKLTVDGDTLRTPAGALTVRDGRLRWDGPAAPASPLLGAELLTLRRVVDALHDEVHAVVLDPASANLDAAGLRAAFTARATRRRAPHPVQLVAVHGDTLHLRTAAGDAVTIGVARARSALAAGALAPAALAGDVDQAVVADLRRFGLIDG